RIAGSGQKDVRRPPAVRGKDTAPVHGRTEGDDAPAQLWRGGRFGHPHAQDARGRGWRRRTALLVAVAGLRPDVERGPSDGSGLAPDDKRWLQPLAGDIPQ